MLTELLHGKPYDEGTHRVAAFVSTLTHKLDMNMFSELLHSSGLQRGGHVERGRLRSQTYSISCRKPRVASCTVIWSLLR